LKDLKGIEAFMSWLRDNRCKAVVMESTGVYWIPLYAALEDEFVKLPRLRFKVLDGIPLEEMVEVLRSAGYVVMAPS